MNLKHVVLMLFGVFLFLGCSTETEEELYASPAKAKISKDQPAEKAVTRPFKSKADGEWFIVESTDCNDLLQYAIVGTGNATHMGKILIEGKICTFPPENVYFLTVRFTAANGDMVVWESSEVFINEFGLYGGGVFNCVEGSGRFENAEGTITVNEVLTVTSIDEATGLPLGGTFTNTGSGTITY